MNHKPVPSAWADSPEYHKAFSAFCQRMDEAENPEDSEETFDQSAEFRSARHAFRKRINCSWGEAC